MIKKHRIKVILLAISIFFLKSFNYYSSNDNLHQNQTLQEELSELGEFILDF